MRIEEVLGPRGELKDLASPPGAMLAYVWLSPDAVKTVSPYVIVIIVSSINDSSHQ